MQIDLTNLSYAAKWYDFAPGARLKIRPCPFSKTNFAISGDDVVIRGADALKVFLFSLVDWEGIVGADGKPLPCTEDVKEKVYDFRLGGIADFVMAQVWQFDEEKDGQEKN